MSAGMIAAGTRGVLMKSAVARKAVLFPLPIASGLLFGCSNDFFKKIEDEAAEYAEQTGKQAYPGALSAGRTPLQAPVTKSCCA